MMALSTTELHRLLLAIADRLDAGGHPFADALRHAAADGCTSSEWLGGIGEVLRAAHPIPADIALDVEQIAQHVRLVWPGFRVADAADAQG